MSGGLLSGLNKAEERPYEGWKTNNFAKSDSPENDDVCLLEHDDSTTGVNDSPNSRKCLSDGPRNPSEFDSKDTSYKIPKKTVSTDSKDRRMSSWIEIDPSFNKEDFLPQSNCRAGLSNEKQRSYGHHSTQRNEIGYRICRQAFFTPRRFKHADAPGWRDCTSPTSQQEKIFSCQVPDTRHNGDVSTDNGKQSAQRHFKTLDEEREHNRSLLDSICQGRTLSIVGLNKVCESKGKNPRTNSTDSDTNFETNTSIVPQQDTPTSSKDENFDDLFSDHCENCTRRLLHDKKCLNCDKHMFPSQAATPRKPLSPERFYSGDSQKPKVQRTYSTTRGNGIRLLTTGTVTKHTDTKNTTGSCQTNSRAKKRKNKGKSNSDSDSENTPGRKKHNGKQLKLSLPKPVDVITLSDEEEEEVVETTAEPTVDESQHDAGTSGSDNATVIPESPSSPARNHKEDEVKSDLGHAVECSKTPVKRKTPPTKEQEPAKKKSDNLHGYTRDDLEIEIMIRADVRIGTLVCTATGPLKITCKTDEIKLSVDFGRKNTLLSIAGNDLTSFKIGLGRNLAVIVLSVTPGYALKLTQRIPNQGKFLNPGSAVAAERDIVLEMSENVTKDVIADLQEWVTDKLSKEFAELSIKDVERIKALKASPSISKEQKQAPSDATSTAMSTRSRTYNTRTNSSKQTAQTVQSLIVYPPLPQPERITVTSEDIPCLSEGEFLNDVIIDFYLKFVFFEKLKSVDRARTHIFSSFFYKQLTKRNNSNSDTFSSPPDRMHSQVKTWTKNVDIFEKDFVIVPINESSHWYLAVICFPGHTTATYISEIPDEEDETNSKNKGPNSVTEEAEKESENDNKKDGSDDDDDDFQLPPLATLQSKSGKRSARRKTLPKQSIKSQPCILIFDSLGGQRQRCMFNLRNYLKVEWRERKKDAEPRDFNKDNIKGNHPKVPQQDNYCDCGVYVLQYMESFFEDPITDFSLPIKKPDWFSLETITGKRKDIRDLIYTLKAAAETGTS